MIKSIYQSTCVYKKKILPLHLKFYELLKKMKKLHLLMLSALVFAATAGQAQNNTVDLSTVNTSFEVKDGQILTGTLGGYYEITIADGASITLSNATINGINELNQTFAYAGLTCKGSATINLEGENTVKGFYEGAGIFVPKGATLKIQGSGKLNAFGHFNGCGIGGEFRKASGDIVIEGGTINATGNNQGAGIGGSANGVSGNITIKGGTVTATGGLYAPGIGSGNNQKVGNITITNTVSSVTATKGEYAPYCIGKANGTNSTCGTITLGDFVTSESIEGESVTFTPSLKSYNVAFEANGGSGEMASVTLLPGFPTHMPQNAFTRSGYKFIGWNTEKDGSGTSYANAEFVTDISTPGSTLTLYAQWYQGDAIDLSTLTGNYEAKNNDILTGTLNGNYKITIKDGATVTLHGVTIEGENDDNYAWAGITCLGDATINLVAKNIVKGFDSEYPGIYVPVDKTLTIKGTGALDASSNRLAAGIGAGWNQIPCGNIVIESGTIKATGGNGAAGIGGGRHSSCGDITIKGGQITALGKTMEDVSGSKAAGIGKGQDATCSKVILGYTKASDYIIANGYIADKITIAEDKTFIVEGVSTTTYTSESTINWETLNGAKLVPSPSAYYTITVSDTQNGIVKASPLKAFNGETITLTTYTAAGYKLKEFIVKDKGGKAITVTNNQFTMPESNVTVAAEFEVDPGTPVSSTPKATANIKVWSFGNIVIIEAAPDTKYTIIDLQGRLIKSATTKSTHEEILISKTGIYLVLIGGKTFKVSVGK